MRIQTMSTAIAVLYLLWIMFLTARYINKNYKKMNTPYRNILFYGSSINFGFLFSAVLISSTQQQEILFLSITFMVMIVGSVLKAKNKRINGEEDLVDFKCYFKFKENFSVIKKFFWHFLLDISVLITAALLNNLYMIIK